MKTVQIKKDISIVIPTFNEIRHGYINRILDELCSIKGIEVIAVDGGSSDGTSELCRSKADRYVLMAGSSRAERMNCGYDVSRGSVVLFHHPRSFISKKAIDELKKFNHHSKKLFWGGFTHTFDSISRGMEFTSWYSNHVRRVLSGILYLDHCIFASRILISRVGGFPEKEIFEDTLFSRELNNYAKPVLLKNISVTSSVRFVKNGFLIQGMLNQIMKLFFLCGVSDVKMNKIYEKGLGLNK